MFLIFPTNKEKKGAIQPVTLLFIVICVVIYLIHFFGILFLPDKAKFEQCWIVFFGLIPKTHDVSGYITHIFAHEEFWHLFWNMIYLLFFGTIVEKRIGSMLFFYFFLVSGVVAALTFVLTMPVSASHAMLGASGAISACEGAFLILAPKGKIHLRWFFLLLIHPYTGKISVPKWTAWILVWIWFASDFYYAFLSLKGHYLTTVAFTAHVGGCIFGVLFGCAYRLMEKIKPEMFQDSEVAEKENAESD